MHALGAEIRRCHSCRYRYARFVRLSVPLGDARKHGAAWTSIAVMSTGFLVCLLFAFWFIRRFTGLSE